MVYELLGGTMLLQLCHIMNQIGVDDYWVRLAKKGILDILKGLYSTALSLAIKIKGR